MLMFTGHAHASKALRGKVFVKALPAGELEKGEAYDILADADNKALVWKCSELYADEGRATLKTQANTAVYFKGELSGIEKNKFKVHRAVKKGETWYQCQDQRVDEHSDTVKNK